MTLMSHWDYHHAYSVYEGDQSVVWTNETMCVCLRRSENGDFGDIPALDGTVSIRVMFTIAMNKGTSPKVQFNVKYIYKLNFKR